MAERRHYQALHETQQQVDDAQQSKAPSQPETPNRIDTAEARYAAEEARVKDLIAQGRISGFTWHMQKFDRSEREAMIKADAQDKDEQRPSPDAAQQRANELNEKVRQQKDQERGKGKEQEQDKSR